MAASPAPDCQACAQSHATPDDQDKQGLPRKRRRRSYWFSLKNLSPWEDQRRKKFHREMPSATGICDHRGLQRAARRVADLRYRLDRITRMETNHCYKRMTGICEREGRPVPKDIVDLKVLASRAFVEDASGSRRLCGFFLDKVALEALIEKALKEYFRVYREEAVPPSPPPKLFQGYPRRGR